MASRCNGYTIVIVIPSHCYIHTYIHTCMHAYIHACIYGYCTGMRYTRSYNYACSDISMKARQIKKKKKNRMKTSGLPSPPWKRCMWSTHARTHTHKHARALAIGGAGQTGGRAASRAARQHRSQIACAFHRRQVLLRLYSLCAFTLRRRVVSWIDRSGPEYNRHAPSYILYNIIMTHYCLSLFFLCVSQHWLNVSYVDI